MQELFLLVDGYNMIGAWGHLKEIKKKSLERARELLVEDLTGFGTIYKCRVIIVFDAYDVRGLESCEKRHDLEIVFTRENETADEYIERFVALHKRFGRKIWVATSDAVQQWQIFGQGALRKPAFELLQEIRNAKIQVQESVQRMKKEKPQNHIPISGEIRAIFEEIRRRK